MTEHVCRFRLTKLTTANCVGDDEDCHKVLVTTEIETCLNEYETLKAATERLEETTKGLFNIIKAYHPEYIDGCECPQCGDMPIYFDTLEGKP